MKSKLTMSHLLSTVDIPSIPEGFLWSFHDISVLLSRDPDIEPMQLLIPIVESAMRGMNLDSCADVTESMMIRLGELGMFVEMNGVMEAFTQRVDGILDDPVEMSRVDSEKVQRAYHRVLLGYARLRGGWTHRQHARILGNIDTDRRMDFKEYYIFDDQVYRLVSHLLETLKTLPGPSMRGHPLQTFMLDRLFHLKFLTPNLRDLVLGYMRGCDGLGGVESITEVQWHRFWITAVLAGDTELADYFMGRKLAISLRKAKDEGNAILEEEEEEEESSGVRVPGMGSLLHTIARMRLLTNRQSSSSSTGTRPHDVSDTLPPDKWTRIFVTADQNRSTSAEDIIQLLGKVPAEGIDARAMSPVMVSLLRRDRPSAVWDIWLDLLSLESNSPASERHTYVDGHILGLAAQACGILEGVEAAMRLVDTYGKRPGSEPSETIYYSIQIDATILNKLLLQCRREFLPSVALRLFVAAESRWGVQPDHASFSIFHELAKRYEIENTRHIDLQNQSVVQADDDFFRQRWQALVQEVFGGRKDRDESDLDIKLIGYDHKAFATGDIANLFDPPGYTWFGEHGRIRPWQRARALFRSAIFANWPELRDIKSPLELESGNALPFLSAFSRRVVFKPADDLSGPAPNPEPGSTWAEMIPDHHTWHSYIKMLCYFSQNDEVPLVFAWMRYLGVKPSFPCMLTGLMYIAEAEGPARQVSNWSRSQNEDRMSDGVAGMARDEEIMRKWLESWLGEGTEDVIMRQNVSLSGRNLWDVRELEKVEGELEEFRVDTVGERTEKAVRRSIVPTEDDLWLYRRRLAQAGIQLMQR
jgi:hypothetical protein